MSGLSADDSHVITSTATIEIAAHGDIMIEIPSGNRLTTLRVASQVLCSTSPVFRAMLGPSSSFKEACGLRENVDSSEPYRLTLKDDNPKALGVILLALHCQNDRVPKKISFQNLIDLAIICDKYDCAAGVLPWVEIWVRPWKSSASCAGYESWLFIAWTFGIGDVFEEVSKKIILEGLIFDSTLSMESGCLNLSLLPEPVMKIIHEKRRACLKSMAEVTLSCRDRYLTRWENTACKLSPPSKSCDAIILGSLMKGFQTLGIAKHFDLFHTESIKGMYMGIKSLRIEFLPVYPPKTAPLKKINVSYTNCTVCIRNPCQCSSKKSEDDHKKKCNPLPELKAKLSAIFNEVKGLDLADFKRSKTPAAKWDLFEYK